MKHAKKQLQGKQGKKYSDPVTVTRDKNDSTQQERPKTFLEEYEQFKKQARTEYENFRDQANREYAEFMRMAWDQHQVMPAIPKPEEKEVPPVVMPEKDKDKPIDSNPVTIDDVVEPPTPKPQPVPVAPIREETKPQEKHIGFTLYGMNLKVRFNDDQRFTLSSCSENAVADAWTKLSGVNYNNTIRDCMEIRIRYQLSDWAYLKMLEKMSYACLGKNTNEATLLMAFVYCQSGYQMRLGVANGMLRMLYTSEHIIYKKSYFEIDGEKLYEYGYDEKTMQICGAKFPQEKPLSLLIPQEQLFGYSKSNARTLVSERYPDIKITISANKNHVDFDQDYPTSMVNDNFMTRWAMYANKPLDKKTRNDLYLALRNKINALNQKEAMERLLNWVQTAFVYEYDDKVWGEDRAFFPEETLYYPYCDCEDRSIFLSRLVRDLLGLNVILVYYPGHLAMAINFTEDVKGDYIMLNGKRYVVCDPTYIGAPVGKTMPGMDNATAKVIMLE